MNLLPSLFTFVALSAGGPAALAIESELTSLPDAQRASIYQANAAAVDELRAVVEDQKRPAFERVGALQRLRSRFREAAINTAFELVNDPSEEVSVAAANILASLIVMMDKDHQHGQSGVTPHETYWNQKLEAARAVLHKVLEGPMRPASDVAARQLMALSDEDAMKIINDGAKKGAYSESVVVNYLGLANPDKSAPYLLPYLDSQNSSAQSAASAYLATNKAYQPLVREKVFANSQASPLARVVASKVLSQNDPAYTTYAPEVATKLDTPEIVGESVIEGMISNLQIKKEAKKDVPGDKAKVNDFLIDLGSKKPRFNVQAYQERLNRL